MDPSLPAPPHLDEFEAGEFLLQGFDADHEAGQAQHLVFIREALTVLQQRLQLPIHLHSQRKTPSGSAQATFQPPFSLRKGTF